MNIKLHIERLVLDGVKLAPSQRHVLQASVESELTWLIIAGGLSPTLVQGTILPRISSSGLHLKAGNHPTQLGQQIAQSVWGGIGHG